jgi:hypothetical protein
MAHSAIEESHFEGHQNLNQGQRKNGDETLAELLRKERRGRVAVAGPGDIAVAFSEAFADTDYTVTGLAFEDTTGGVHADLDIKAGTIAAGGFTVTVAGVGAVGILHYSAAHD